MEEDLQELEDILNSKDETGRTTLQVAIESKNEEAFRFLLNTGANVNLKSDRGGALLHHLARNPDFTSGVELAKTLLSLGADVNAVDEFKNTPLHVSALYENEQIFKLLLNWEANMNSRCSLGRTALHCLALNPQFSRSLELAIDLLVGRRGNRGADVNIGDASGNTPLHLAAKHGHLKMLELLLRTKVEVDARNIAGQTALHYLAARKSLAAVKLASKMLSYEHRADVNAKAGSGRIPLHLAASWANLDMVKLLLHKGADVDRKDYSGFTPLINAIVSNDVLVVQTLLEYGANVNARDDFRGSPLEVACNFHDRRSCCVVECLLQFGADPNAIDVKGYTVLLYLMRYRNPSLELVKRLLEYGADVNVVAEDDENVLSMKPEEGFWKVIVEHVATLKARNSVVHSSLIRTISENAEYDAHLTACERELTKAKVIKPGFCEVTYFDLLVMDDRSEVERYAEDNSFVDYLRKNYNVELPIYGGVIFRKITREVYFIKLWEYAAYRILRDSSLSYPEDFDIVRDILDFMSLKDLEKFCW